MRKIEAISYQRKTTGYNKDNRFPTEITVTYAVGMTVHLPVNTADKVVEIIEDGKGYLVSFEKGYSLWVSDEKDVEVLYGAE